MSRAERRQYQRMMKGTDPRALPPRPGGQRPPRRRGSREPHDWSFNRGFWLKSTLLAAAAGAIGLSVVWSSGAERALLVSGASAVAVIGLLVVFRLLMQRRAATR